MKDATIDFDTKIFIDRFYDGYGLVLFENPNKPSEAYVLIQGIGFVNKAEAMVKYNISL